MSMIVKKRSKKRGLSPGTLVHIGEKRERKPLVTVIDYDEEGFHETILDRLEECVVIKDKSVTTWINVEGVHDIDIVQRLGECFGLHPLVLEDILNTDQRPKIEDYNGYLYIVLKMLYACNDTGVLTEQISIILGRNFVISFQEGIEGDVFNAVRDNIRTGKGRIRSLGADYLAYSLIDAIVDNYFLALERIDEMIEDLEDEIITRPSNTTSRKIHELKRDMIFLRKAVWPLREVINMMERGESPLIKDTTKVYLKDVYDHTIYVMDAIEALKDMLSGMLDIYLSSISNKMNEIMKFLTIIGTIFIPLTFIVGIYGMNFEYMPELKWRWGYFTVIGIMLAIAIFMLIYFKKKKWL